MWITKRKCQCRVLEFGGDSGPVGGGDSGSDWRVWRPGGLSSPSGPERPEWACAAE
jgi:hypothetical protein